MKLTLAAGVLGAASTLSLAVTDAGAQALRWPLDERASPADPKMAMGRTEAILFPPNVTAKVLGDPVDTLVIVPQFDFATLPWAALKIQGRALVDLASVLVAPGFASFRSPPRVSPPGFPRAIVVGHPEIPEDKEYVLPPLPGARSEAEAVGKLVSARPLIGPRATRVALERLLQTSHRDPALVYLATHCGADPMNPLDGGKLWLADGRWEARDIRNLPLRGGRPLVVLSACQSGLYGMPRSWERRRAEPRHEPLACGRHRNERAHDVLPGGGGADAPARQGTSNGNEDPSSEGPRPGPLGEFRCTDS
jgi:hypothetical protein